jgi:hypothetical protein
MPAALVAHWLRTPGVIEYIERALVERKVERTVSP